MKTLRLLFTVLTLGLCSARLAALEQTVQVNMDPKAQAIISYTAACNLPPNGGTLPIRVKIENQGAEERTWSADFTYQQSIGFPLSQLGGYTLREHFTVPGGATLEKVIFVQAPERNAANAVFHIATQGPDVRGPVNIIPSSSTPMTAATILVAASPALESALTGMRSSKERLVIYQGRDGSTQTRSIQAGTYGWFRISNGDEVFISTTGSPNVVASSTATEHVKFDVSPAGDVTLRTPSGTYVSGTQTRLENTGGANPRTPQNLPPPSVARAVIIQGPSLPQPRTYLVPSKGTGTFNFSDGTRIIVPFDAQPSISNAGASKINMDLDVATNRLTITLPGNERIVRTSISGGPTNFPAQLRSGALPTTTPPTQINARSDTLIAGIDPLRWPADHRVWGLFHMIVMEVTEWERLDEARRTAIKDWVALGGTLVLSPETESEKRILNNYGLGSIITLEKSAKDYTKDSLIALAPGNPVEQSKPWQRISRLLKSTDIQKQVIPPKNGLPIILLLIFGIVAGPLALFKLAPAGRRHRLFVIIPLLSLGTSVLLITVVVLRDGIGGNGIRKTMVLLLPEDKRAVVFQQQVSKTGLLLGSSFTLSPEISMQRGLETDGPLPAGKSFKSSYIREGDKAHGEWFGNRTVQIQVLRTVVPTRARIELLKTAEDTAPSVRSNMPNTLSYLAYMDEKNGYWIAENIAPGAVVQLRRDPKTESTNQNMLKLPPMKTGWFYALGTAGDLAPIQTHPSINWEEDDILYVGQLSDSKEASK